MIYKILMVYFKDLTHMKYLKVGKSMQVYVTL